MAQETHRTMEQNIFQKCIYDINFEYKVTLHINRKNKLLVNSIIKLAHAVGFHLTRCIGINSNIE